MQICNVNTIFAGKPTSLAGARFLDLLSEDEMAFDNLYCVAFQMMDAQWLAKRASYMQFNVRNILPPDLPIQRVTKMKLFL